MDFTDQVARFVDPASLLIVFGGAFAVAAMRSSREDLSRAFAALGPLFNARPDADATAAIRAVNAIAMIAEVKSIASADRVRTAGLFLRRAAYQLANASTADAFAWWAADETEARRLRHEGAIGVWRAMADAGPAMGMIGTIIGLVRMFANMDDPARIGPAMALAMLTTLYGIIVAGVIAGPIAARLERLSEAERAWQRRALDRLERLARAEIVAPGPRGALRTAS